MRKVKRLAGYLLYSSIDTEKRKKEKRKKKSPEQQAAKAPYFPALVENGYIGMPFAGASKTKSRQASLAEQKKKSRDTGFKRLLGDAWFPQNFCRSSSNKKTRGIVKCLSFNAVAMPKPKPQKLEIL